MMKSLFREIAESIAEYIRGDRDLQSAGHVCVVVEDKADVETAIAEAIGQLGVLVLVIISGFDRRSSSGAELIGTAKVEIRCFEHPSLNRDGTAWSAQRVAEHLMRILHWREIPGLHTPMRFSTYARDDFAEANIVRMNFVTDIAFGVSFDGSNN